MTLFRPDTARALALGLLCFLFAVTWGAPLIRHLRRRQISEAIRVDGPQTHLSKAGTPTMGGLMILIPTLIFCSLFIMPEYLSLILPLSMLVLIGGLGIYDDITKLRQKRAGQPKEGISANTKLAWQFATAIGAAVVLGSPDLLDMAKVAIPGVSDLLAVPLWLYVPIAALLIVGFSNAVNLADGLDGLAGGVAAIAFASYGVLALRHGFVHLATFSFCMAGGTLAFLWFNAYPAQLFMGDTGSLALGATLAIVALMTLQWPLLPIVGIIFVAMAASNVLQVASAKFSRRFLGKDKRLFKMAPIHHHFELLGWSEVQIVQRFWIVAMLAGMFGIALGML
ncbi:MAG: phospho-N-acetylmuramoyl-pentapeptide-transferase [Anaerolineales bacterium]|nr:phospho-N-acetylmuramoyl-pentapeptide-transferase [Anaerolineales bacterium]MCB9127945.1 phospho-N-acetylmuramoyl-pentapeptide-transferase [Ardenticatenales bacterium]MCB9171707.1 phospho-N-acetylmuramoyl-pentapeptide-transferase [Ardenticatenales bacterium]